MFVDGATGAAAGVDLLGDAVAGVDFVGDAAAGVGFVAEAAAGVGFAAEAAACVQIVAAAGVVDAATGIVVESAVCPGLQGRHSPRNRCNFSLL